VNLSEHADGAASAQVQAALLARAMDRSLVWDSLACKKAKPVPIVLYGTDYWRRLVDFDVLVEAGAIAPEDLTLFRHADRPDEAWALIRDFYGLEG